MFPFVWGVRTVVPAARGSTRDINHLMANDAGIKRDRILIVDDEECIVYLFRTILTLSFSNIDVDVARNGMQAIESFRENRPDLLLLDLHMPVMDGFSAYSQIESLCATESWDMPSVVFCTGFAPPEKLSQVLASHPDHGFLPKPVSPDELLEAVEPRLSV